MTREDIIRMARESEWLSKYDSSTGFSAEVAIRFAELVAAHFEYLPGRQPVQVPVAEFVEMVIEKEHLTGIPIVWAEWPNREKTNDNQG